MAEPALAEAAKTSSERSRLSFAGNGAYGHCSFTAASVACGVHWLAQPASSSGSRSSAQV